MTLSGSDSRIVLSLIVPLYNLRGMIEANVGRLADFLDRMPYPCELLVVDDSSRDGSLELALRGARGRPGVRFFRARRNLGKGACVGHGLSVARGNYRLYIDADLPYPFAAVRRVVGLLQEGCDVAATFRRRVSFRGWDPHARLRHLLSRLYNVLARALLLPGLRDSQAGLKGFRAQAARLILARQTARRFDFDLECLVAARCCGLRVGQTPVVYRPSGGSTVRLLRDGPALLWALGRVWLRRLLGRYAPVPRAREMEPCIDEIPASVSL